MRIAYFDCFSGISGDMCLGALVSAGWPASDLESLPRRIGLDDVRVTVGSARRGPFAATRVEVAVAGRQPHRHLHHVIAMIDRAEVEPTVREKARVVFRKLAEAEAEVHGSTVDKVHFHEVGAADALVDVLGTLEGLHSLGVERCFASSLRLGRGSVASEHGPIPVPAPATTLLLRGAPVELPDVRAELVTPTGAALLATLVESWSAPPAFRLERVGTGAGGRDLEEQPNVLRLLIGDAETSLGRRRIAVLETALDDENPQFVAALMPRLAEAGALDAMLVPTLMKKGRPGTWLVVIAEPSRADALARILLTETTTLGVRLRFDERYELERSPAEVETPFGCVRLKVASLPGGGSRAVPEFESVRAAAEKAGRPIREVAEAALAAWRSGPGGGS
ncbi:MAG: nickel pincer cofactor biosynthesis protein LarC [Candidatus Eisenbacteria bacterium]|uniref:Putative nickel insertion protein n=1 Tax=Eiseniibacteriota bacterium TaxID=2212470 RepID=A0A538SNZ7_UNCEI|nr:MAG: nickel pincer cofactor biosynthesis protein LarC [Candidatus Eisenbacteria bacterium]